jgi:hypothetical protein
MSAQKKIVLNSPKMQHIDTHLYDEEGNFLLTLPLTFNMSNKTILSMMVGKDSELGFAQSVWFFSDKISLQDLIKKNHNVNAEKLFKKNNSDLNTILLTNRKISLFRAFDDGCEIITKNAKPVFFEIIASPQPITFYLQFYVSKPDNKYPFVFFAKCKPIEIELTTK